MKRVTIYECDIQHWIGKWFSFKVTGFFKCFGSYRGLIIFDDEIDISRVKRIVKPYISCKSSPNTIICVGNYHFVIKILYD